MASCSWQICKKGEILLGEVFVCFSSEILFYYTTHFPKSLLWVSNHVQIIQLLSGIHRPFLLLMLFCKQLHLHVQDWIRAATSCSIHSQRSCTAFLSVTSYPVLFKAAVQEGHAKLQERFHKLAAILMQKRGKEMHYKPFLTVSSCSSQKSMGALWTGPQTGLKVFKCPLSIRKCHIWYD